MCSVRAYAPIERAATARGKPTATGCALTEQPRAALLSEARAEATPAVGRRDRAGLHRGLLRRRPGFGPGIVRHMRERDHRRRPRLVVRRRRLGDARRPVVTTDVGLARCR